MGLIAECEFGVAEERFVGGGDEDASHIEDGVGGLFLNAGGEFLGLGFECGVEWLRHGAAPAGANSG